MLQALTGDVSDDTEMINVKWYNNVIYLTDTYCAIFHPMHLFLSIGIILIFQIATVNVQTIIAIIVILMCLCL